LGLGLCRPGVCVRAAANIRGDQGIHEVNDFLCQWRGNTLGGHFLRRPTFTAGTGPLIRAVLQFAGKAGSETLDKSLPFGSRFLPRENGEALVNTAGIEQRCR
jgi:hypothetical protein